MGRITGKDGAVNGAACVHVWEVDATAKGGQFSGSGAHGAIDRITGAKDWKGRYGAYGHTPIVMPGEAFAFVGTIDGEAGIYGTAIVEAVRIDIEIPQEEDALPRPVSHVVSFAANGTLSKTAASATDITVPNPPNPGDLIFKYCTPAGSPTWTTISEVNRATITIARRNPTYRPGSSTYQTYRLSGNLDAQVQLECHTNNFYDLPAEGTIKGVQVFVNSTQCWEVNWMLIEALNAMTVPIESGDIVSAKPQMSFKSNTLIGSTPTHGSIKKPGGTTWWPT